MVGLYFKLIICEICVELGMVDIFVLLISGLILLFFFKNRLKNLINMIFDVVVMMKENVLRIKIKIEF